MKDIANPEETFEETVVERPNSCAIRMPWELYKILNWKSNDGLEWTYIDKDRVLLQRIPAEHGEEGEPIPDETFQPVKVDAPKAAIPTEEELREQIKTQDDYRKEAKENPTTVMTQEEIDAMVAQAPVESSSDHFTKEFELPVDHMTAPGEDLPSEDEIRDTKKQLIDRYSTTVVDEEGNEKTVQRHEPEGGYKKGTPEYEFERKRIKKQGPPPKPEDGGIGANEESE